MSKATLTVAAVAIEAVTETSFEVAVARATVEASITLNFAVPVAIVVTGQKCVLYVASYAHLTGVVADPPTSASAAADATMYAAPAQFVPLASTAVTAIAVELAPTLRTGLYTAAVRVLAAFA